MSKNYEEELEQAMEDAKLTDQEEKEQAEEDVVLKLKEEISDLTDKLLRNAAEADNMRKRCDKMVEEAKTYAMGNFAKDMLSVMDNFSRALEHKPEAMSLEVENILTGVEMTKQEMINIFKKYKMVAISPSIGDKFDYNLHNAVSQIPSSEYPVGTIMQVVQPGYMIEERLLRPATVIVTKAME